MTTDNKRKEEAINAALRLLSSKKGGLIAQVIRDNELIKEAFYSAAEQTKLLLNTI